MCISTIFHLVRLQRILECYSIIHYEDHLKFVLNKLKKTIGLLCKFQQIHLRKSLITIYKLFIWPHLKYGNIVYDRAFNESFHKNIESIQYNAVIAITGTITGTSSENFFQELVLESLKSWHWFRKIFHEKSPFILSANSTKQ